MKLRYVLQALRDQLPIRRFLRNFLVTRNAWGLFHINSHVAQRSGKPKVGYPTKASAIRAGENMGKKTGYHYSPYKCCHCADFHIGRNRDSIAARPEQRP
jgi:hypothetical protein